MKRDELLALYEEAKKHVLLSCCEYHAHSARQGCLAPKKSGDEPYVTICILAERLFHMDARLAEIAEELKLK